MKTTTRSPYSCAPSRFLRSRFAVALQLVLLLSLSTVSSYAGSATWKATPATGNWNTAANWTPSTVPDSSTDTATFAFSNTTGISLPANEEVNGIVYNVGSSAFTTAVTPGFALTISGAGVTNNSGITQNFVANSSAPSPNGTIGVIEFTNSATAGSLSIFTNQGGLAPPVGGSYTTFAGSATAGSSTFINQSGQVDGAGGGGTQFSNTSSAANGVFINKGGVGSNGRGGVITFFDAATAADGTFTTEGAMGPGATGGLLLFSGTSSADHGIFSFAGAAVSNASTSINFQMGSGSTAASGIFNIGGGAVTGAFGAEAVITGTATAADATFIVSGGAVSGAGGGTLSFAAPSFGDHPTAGNAILIGNGGTSGGNGASIRFDDVNIGLAPNGGTARFELFGNGNLDISPRTNTALTVGSLEGNGIVFLGQGNLKIGSRNLDTTFSGVLQDGGILGGTGGSLTKAGRARLTLTGASTYTGGTTVNRGTLIVSNRSGSGTGTGAVQVNKGTLGSTGKISGAVTVGNGSTSGAILLPGTPKKPGTLTINNTLTLNSLSTYQCVLNRATPAAGKVSALGVTINSSATFTFLDTGTGTLATGTVFTVINNTSASPIAGTFNNLANGAVFASHGNNFQVSYIGGTGNDLTLTVVQ